MGIFQASTQYDDWVGQVTADNADHDTPIQHFSDYMRRHGLLPEGKQIVGIDAFYHHERDPDEKTFSVRVIVVKAKDRDEATRAMNSKTMLNVVEVIEDKSGDVLWFTTQEFFNFFKRFSLVLQPNGVESIGKDIPAYNP